VATESRLDPDDADRELTELLGRLAERVDPVPADVLSAARGVFKERRGSEHLELIHDSAPSTDDALSSSHRTLIFRGEEVEIDLIVVANGDRRCLVGRVAPTLPTTVEVATTEQTFIDDGAKAGEFRVDDLAPGPVSIVVDFGDDSELGRPHTDWVTV
jgi:hypothetical protein